MHKWLALSWLALFSNEALGESQQRIIFEAESIEYKHGDRYWTDEIQKECSELDEDVEAYLNAGWKVVASSAKTKVVSNNRGTCVGTEYVLEKPLLEKVKSSPSLLLVVVSSAFAGILLALGFQRFRRSPMNAATGRSAAGAESIPAGWRNRLALYVRNHRGEALLCSSIAFMSIACLVWGARVLGLRKELANEWYEYREGYAEFVNGVVFAERVLGVMTATLLLLVITVVVKIRRRRREADYV